MITELEYSHIVDYIEELCTKNKLLLHNPKNNIRFYPDIECFKGDELLTPSVILIGDTGNLDDNNTDSTTEMFRGKLLIMGTTAEVDDSRDRVRITDKCKKIADQFAKRMRWDSGFENDTDDIKFINCPLQRILKTPIPFSIFRPGWGGYELDFTLGAPTLMYVDQDDVTEDWEE